jgi:ATP-dependent Lon protease
MSKNRLKKRKFRKQKDESESEIYRVNSLNDFIVEDEYEPEKEEDGSFDPVVQNRKREYFEVDSEPLREELTSVLSEKLKVNVNEIEPLVSDVFSNSQYMLEDYLGSKPSTNNWKIGIDDETVNKIEPELLSIRKEMENEVPTILKIMDSNITKNDKKECLRLFYQTNNVEAYSEDYFRFIDEINTILKKGIIYTKTEIKFLEDEEEKLKNMYVSIDTLKTKILKLEADSTIKSKLLAQYEQMMTYPTDSSTYTSLKEEIEWSIKLPYQKREIDPYVSMNNVQLNKFYYQVLKKLDKDLYGMEKVKDRIIHILNDRRSSGDECGRNIALVSKPGCGKTEICKVLAKILNKKFAKISAGGLDSALIKGSSKVWASSEPSIILQILSDLKTNNAIIMFDEVDKLGETLQGKLAQYALLHLSDPSNNKEFQDNYLKNFSHDLSKVLFIFCMNSTDTLDPALKDRLDIIEVDEYTNGDKLQIFKNYMLPKALLNIGMQEKDILINDEAIKNILSEKELGLRDIEKIIKNIVSKINMYKNISLPKGTIGNFKLNYEIPNFKIPLKIDYKLLNDLI